MLPRWTRLSRERLISTKWFDFVRDRFRLPNGFEGEYTFVSRNHCAMIIPIMDNGNILLHRQYRYLIDDEFIEFPCGGSLRADDGNGAWKDAGSPEETARRELEEETGMTGDLEFIRTIAPYNGISDEMQHVFVARHLQLVHREKDDTEEFEAIFMSPKDNDAAIADGTIRDGMTIAAWTLARGKI
jgi:ADP-ribose pyrophosphatase